MASIVVGGQSRPLTLSLLLSLSLSFFRPGTIMQGKKKTYLRVEREERSWGRRYNEVGDDGLKKRRRTENNAMRRTGKARWKKGVTGQLFNFQLKGVRMGRMLPEEKTQRQEILEVTQQTGGSLIICGV